MNENEIKQIRTNERERIARQLEENADLCGNINVMSTIQYCARTVRTNIPNSYTDNDYCTRVASGQHRWAEYCADCGAPKEEIVENPEQIKDNDAYWSYLNIVSQLEMRIDDLEKQLKASIFDDDNK